ncbi:hypothetical protein EDB85DRAFT_1888135 [Lactarius pseudohatsudake]|nr:hypothetical protein EDB85DRAFT_1888135 [Lactarius pseudohatsudake]
MLRPRHQPDWKLSWVTTRKRHFDTNGGQSQSLRVCMDATWISDGRPVMLEKAFLQGASFFGPQNHGARLLDVIQISNQDPLMVHHPLLRPFDNPPLRTYYEEFVAFFAQICEDRSETGHSRDYI